MFRVARAVTSGLTLVALAMAPAMEAQDWPQWRGPNRDAKAKRLELPKTWPEKLTQKWTVDVGDGVSTPALAGGKLYVFAREDGSEVIRCLDAGTGNELWQEKYAAAAVSGPARSFSGPRSSPTVAGGSVVTLGVEGVLSCYDAQSGKVRWRQEDLKGQVPRFSTASSPIVVDGLCVAQLGGSSGGGVFAFDLATGKEKWKWTGAGPAYGSPVLTTVGGTKAIVTPTDESMVALSAADGSLLWQVEYSQGRYNAATPIVDGDMLFFAGPERGMTAVKLSAKDGKLAAEEVWRNTDESVQFNTPVLAGGLLIGLSTMSNVFAIDAKSGKTAWSVPVDASSSSIDRDPGRPVVLREEGGRGRGRGRGRSGGRGGGGGGYGSVVEAGSVLLTLTRAGSLAVFGLRKEAPERLASYKVAEGSTYAYPVITGKGVFVKDASSVAFWAY